MISRLAISPAKVALSRRTVSVGVSVRRFSIRYVDPLDA
jgi:hypothetical protein